MNRGGAIPDDEVTIALRRAADRRYWRSNALLVVVLLVVWAAVGLGCGVLFADRLAQWHLGGFPLGFWFAQQGSILTFVLLILVYALLMGRLDRRHAREIQRIARDPGATGAGGEAP